MSPELIAGLSLFAMISSITPGPNNIMLMTSGVNFGIKRTLPHMLGVAIGFTAMVALVGLGVMIIFDQLPWLYDVLHFVSLIYLCYLAYKIATTTQPGWQTSGPGIPMTFWQAALFQWVNPKAWTMALTAVTVYAPERDLISVSLIALVFGTINLPCIACWVFTGSRLRKLLSQPRVLRVFNYAMAGLLLVSVIPSL